MAVIKAINSKSSLLNILNYIKNTEKTEEKLVSGLDCNPSTSYMEMKNTKELYGKNEGRQYKHIIQSFFPKDNITPEKANILGRELAEKHFRGYEVVIATHRDKEHIHNHIVINSVSHETGNKLHQTKDDLARLKHDSDRICEREGLHVIDKSYKDERFTMTETQIEKKNEVRNLEERIPVWKKEIKTAIKEGLMNTNSINELKEYLKTNNNIEMKITNKNLSFLHPDKQKYVRGKTLGNIYTKESIVNFYDRDIDVVADKTNVIAKQPLKDNKEVLLYDRFKSFMPEEQKVIVEAEKYFGEKLNSYQIYNDMKEINKHIKDIKFIIDFEKYQTTTEYESYKNELETLDKNIDILRTAKKVFDDVDLRKLRKELSEIVPLVDYMNIKEARAIKQTYKITNNIEISNLKNIITSNDNNAELCKNAIAALENSNYRLNSESFNKEVQESFTNEEKSIIDKASEILDGEVDVFNIRKKVKELFKNKFENIDNIKLLREAEKAIYSCELRIIVDSSIKDFPQTKYFNHSEAAFYNKVKLKYSDITEDELRQIDTAECRKAIYAIDKAKSKEIEYLTRFDKYTVEEKEILIKTEKLLEKEVSTLNLRNEILEISKNKDLIINKINILEKRENYIGREYSILKSNITNVSIESLRDKINGLNKRMTFLKRNVISNMIHKKELNQLKYEVSKLEKEISINNDIKDKLENYKNEYYTLKYKIKPDLVKGIDKGNNNINLYKEADKIIKAKELKEYIEKVKDHFNNAKHMTWFGSMSYNKVMEKYNIEKPEEIIQRYKSLKPKVESYEAEIKQYTELSKPFIAIERNKTIDNLNKAIKTIDRVESKELITKKEKELLYEANINKVVMLNQLKVNGFNSREDYDNKYKEYNDTIKIEISKIHEKYGYVNYEYKDYENAVRGIDNANLKEHIAKSRPIKDFSSVFEQVTKSITREVRKQQIKAEQERDKENRKISQRKKNDIER